MSFNRRRVTLTCSLCRHRKRRCDAGKPSCQGCIEAEVPCEYDTTPVRRIDSSGGSREIISRLQEIETLLQDHVSTVASLSSGIESIVAQSTGHVSATSPSNQTQVSVPASTLQAAHILSQDLAGTISQQLQQQQQQQPWPDSFPVSMSLEPQPEIADLPPLIIPVGHKTSSNYLLRSPEMKQMIGEYPDDLFFLIESRSPLPPQLSYQPTTTPFSPDQMDKDVLKCLMAAFFSHAYPCHPILDREEFDYVYDVCLEGSNPSSIESALCMVVFAVGTAILAPPGAQGYDTRPPGMEYIEVALPTLMSMSSWSFNYSLLLPKALVIASLYFAYIVRPLQS